MRHLQVCREYTQLDRPAVAIEQTTALHFRFATL